MKSQTPQSAACVLMTEPSAEASRPTMMTVQASDAKARSSVRAGAGGPFRPMLTPPARMRTAATARTAGIDLLLNISATSRGRPRARPRSIHDHAAGRGLGRIGQIAADAVLDHLGIARH